jgi:DNA-binding GntR family transcriptional regulator
LLKQTSAEEIRGELAARIISGDLGPGAGLDETQIATEYAVSRTPVREAIRLLAASGLVDHRPHATALVAKPDAQVLAGMFEVMGYLEALCAGLSAMMMTVVEREGLGALHQRMAVIVRDGDAKRYAEANDAFHAAIYEGAHNAYLDEITRATRLRLQPFRKAQFNALGRLAKSHAEHDAVVEAILRADRSAAEIAMRHHISIVEDAYRHLRGGGR